MDKKKLIAIIATVVVAVVGMLLKVDLKEAVCGAPVVEVK